MKVLHLGTGNLFGGIEAMLLAIAGAGDAAGMETRFATCFPGKLRDELRRAGAEARELPAARTSRPWTVIRARRALAALLRREPVDFAVAHGPWVQAVFGPVVRTSGARSVFWAHNVADGRHWIERWAKRARPELVVANSRHTAATLDSLYPGVPRTVVHCPVRPRRIRDAATEADRKRIRNERGIGEGEVLIVHYSRLEPWKGHELLIDALAELARGSDAPKGWTCRILAIPQRPEEAAYLERLRARATAAGLGDRLAFADATFDVPDLLAAGDVFCQPNLSPEPFGVAPVEALYAGLPVVATALGGSMEIVNDGCGLLVEPEAGALAGALRTLATDAGLRERLAAAAPRRARKLCDPDGRMGELAEALRAIPR